VRASFGSSSASNVTSSSSMSSGVSRPENALHIQAPVPINAAGAAIAPARPAARSPMREAIHAQAATSTVPNPSTQPSMPRPSSPSQKPGTSSSG
jgi:hypothetical protein